MSNILSATEVLIRRDEWHKNIADELHNPVSRLGFLLAVQAMIIRQWDADAARFNRVHDSINQDNTPKGS